MKYAFMSFSTPELSLSRTLQMAAELGYDGVEPRLDSRHAHGIEVDTTKEERRRIIDQARSANVSLCCLASSLKFSDPEANREMLVQARERIDLAGDLKVPCLRVFGGSIPSGIERQQAIEIVVDALRSLTEQAADRGVTLCLETHDDWCDPAHVAAVVSRVEHQAVAVNWDIMHPVRTGCATMRQAFDHLKPWIRHVHAHDGVTENGRLGSLVPIGQGEIDHREALRCLREISYNGFISGEWIGWEAAETHLPRELKTFREIEAALE